MTESLIAKHSQISLRSYHVQKLKNIAKNSFLTFKMKQGISNFAPRQLGFERADENFDSS